MRGRGEDRGTVLIPSGRRRILRSGIGGTRSKDSFTIRIRHPPARLNHTTESIGHCSIAFIQLSRDRR